MIKNLVKEFIIFCINTLEFIFLKFSIGSKPLFPIGVPFKKYFLLKNIDSVKNSKYKILLPFSDVKIFDGLNLYKPYELLSGEIIKRQSQKTVTLGENATYVILPIALVSNNSFGSATDKIELKMGETSYDIELKYKNRFHYLPLRRRKPFREIEVKTGNYDIAIGRHFCPTKSRNHTRPSLVVHIMIDALSKSALELLDSDVIPNITHYFATKGVTYSNAFAQSEWTLSSMAGVFTGCYTNEHLVYHPRRNDTIRHDTIADILSREGFFTFGCVNVPKMSPANGFDKGFNRFIYADTKDADFVINQAMDQMESFESPKYIFMGIFDIHEAHKLQPMSVQLKSNLSDFKFRNLAGNSKDTSVLFDRERLNMYAQALKNFDKKLKVLFEKIDELDPNALVILHSDHGVNFITKTTELLGKERQKSVLFFKNNKKPKQDDRVIELRSVSKMIFEDLGISISYQGLNNKYALSESIYPNKDYEISVRSASRVMFYKVSWNDLISKNTQNFKLKTSYHHFDDELVNCEHDQTYFCMLDAANRHYKKLIDNMQRNM